MKSQVVARPRVDGRPPARTTIRGSGPNDCGTPGFSPYRCFLPDLAGFGDPSCAGPDLQRRLPRPGVRAQTSAREFGPAKADCRCRGPPAPHLARPLNSLPALNSRSRAPRSPDHPAQGPERPHGPHRADALAAADHVARVLVEKAKEADAPDQDD